MKRCAMVVILPLMFERSVPNSSVRTAVEVLKQFTWEYVAPSCDAVVRHVADYFPAMTEKELMNLYRSFKDSSRSAG
jgi:dGTP triphosphohydrolase